MPIIFCRRPSSEKLIKSRTEVSMEENQYPESDLSTPEYVAMEDLTQLQSEMATVPMQLLESIAKICHVSILPRIYRGPMKKSIVGLVPVAIHNLCDYNRYPCVDCEVDSVWNALPDYERLADFIPNHIFRYRIAFFLPIFNARIPCVHPGRIWLEQEFPAQEFPVFTKARVLAYWYSFMIITLCLIIMKQKRMLSAQTTYSCSISEDSCQKRKQIKYEAAD
ncbi:hypothetical protein L2E82_33664 [Cichorium intybus]|uniref:Uncharacterized protein n=1 Tax=Cichorium intybus TaxID=13427 RepID=A0ACB9BKT7_CICIN|nr:hypothetical protein L2E82_33664 [Cichorium intybus]